MRDVAGASEQTRERVRAGGRRNRLPTRPPGPPVASAPDQAHRRHVRPRGRSSTPTSSTVCTSPPRSSGYDVVLSGVTPHRDEPRALRTLDRRPVRGPGAHRVGSCPHANSPNWPRRVPVVVAGPPGRVVSTPCAVTTRRAPSRHGSPARPRAIAGSCTSTAGVRRAPPSGCRGYRRAARAARAVRADASRRPDRARGCRRRDRQLLESAELPTRRVRVQRPLCARRDGRPHPGGNRCPAAGFGARLRRQPAGGLAHIDLTTIRQDSAGLARGGGRSGW